MEWKTVPQPEPGSASEAIARALSEPEFQAGITGVVIIALILLSRWIAERPYRKHRPPDYRNIMM